MVGLIARCIRDVGTSLSSSELLSERPEDVLRPKEGLDVCVGEVGRVLEICFRFEFWFCSRDGGRLLFVDGESPYVAGVLGDIGREEREGLDTDARD